jgi:phosphatidate phosphatase LPIN
VKTAQAFKQNIVTYEKLSADPNLIFHPDMVFRVENKLYPWAVAAPYLVGLFAFQRRLDANVMEQHYTKWKEANTKSSGSVWTRWLPRGWRRQETSVPSTPIKGGPTDSLVKTSSSNSLSRSDSKTQLPGPAPDSSAANFDDDDEESESGTDMHGNKMVYTKSLKPLPEQLAALNLQPGKNKIQFKVKSSKTKGSFAEVTSNVFLWESTVKIVVSDIDGTITKTDVFGQIFPVFGKDWSHIGVAELFSNIKANGYQVLYLTARSIGAASITKEYLASLKQESGHTLPDGPVFMSPDRLLNALNREVILRKPEQFKIACLSDIKNLFPIGSYPFYAGFGNRHTDAISYVAVSIPKAKIFIINPQGEIECASKSVRRSYTKINELVEQMFPPYHINVATKTQAEEEWNDFNYWRSASSLSVSIDDIEAALKPSK